MKTKECKVVVNNGIYCSLDANYRLVCNIPDGMSGAAFRRWQHKNKMDVFAALNDTKPTDNRNKATFKKDGEYWLVTIRRYNKVEPMVLKSRKNEKEITFFKRVKNTMIYYGVGRFVTDKFKFKTTLKNG